MSEDSYDNRRMLVSAESEETNNVPADTREAPEIDARLIVVALQESGDFVVNPIGIDQFAVPTILRRVAGEVERQLGA